MSLNSATLSRAAGVAAILSGVIFIGVQIGHPHLDVTSVGTTEWVIRNTAKMAFASLALAGITGMYLRQIKQAGLLGLVGYLLLAIGYLLITCTAFVAGYVLPSLALSDPTYVDGVLTAAAGGTPTSDIGLINYALVAEGITFLAGGLLFGIATFRARILVRWAAVLLAVGAVVTLALPLLPDSLYRALAYPNAVALIGLGISLWRNPSSSEVATSRSALDHPSHTRRVGAS